MALRNTCGPRLRAFFTASFVLHLGRFNSTLSESSCGSAADLGGLAPSANDSPVSDRNRPGVDNKGDNPVFNQQSHWSLRSAALLCLVPALLTARPLPSGSDTSIVTQMRTVQQVRDHLQSSSHWHPFPKISERDRWNALAPAVRSAYVREAEKLIHTDWPTPQATTFLEFVRTGNRSRYQAVSYGRRQQLATLVLAECIEGKGRFRDDIINGIWTICEESYWGVPAHVGLQRAGAGLPDVEEPTVDLFAAETGSLLAWTYYLLKDSLDAVSPLVSARIRYEVDRRINAVNLARDDFWWMGFTDRKVNNWDPVDLLELARDRSDPGR